MVNFNHAHIADKRPVRIDYLFYVVSIFLAAAVLSYLIFNFKIQLQEKMIQDIEVKLLSLNTGDRQVYNKKVLDYKKKINDFSALLDNHKITSNIFSFIESKTLPNVWFSDFNIQKETNELRLSGFTDDMGFLSRQVQLFEQSNDYVESITVFSSEINVAGNVNFILDLSLRGEIFNYQTSFLNET